MCKITIEQKAYNEALERARQLLRTSVAFDRFTIEKIFPELKESEDEKSKKWILEYLYDGLRKSDEQFKDHFKTAIAWLEKQGEQKPQGKSALEAIKEEKVDNANKVEPKDYNSIDPHFGKPADKAEPKFHEGEWIVWQNKCYKVYYNGCSYELIDQDGLSTSLEYGTIDESAHLWDVTKDAKDGDVLIEDSCIFIIQKLGDNSTAAKTYCTLYNDGDFNDGSILYFDIDSTKPATKEQRDLLFSKMKEAGYEWDAEKKELKIVDWSKHIKCNPNAPSIIKENPVWSEKDEHRVKDTIYFLETAKKHYANTVELDKCITWLNSLLKK